MTTPPVSSREWLEADGLGGFASGTSTGIRTRRYHALLLTATTPPTGRMVLVNGFDAWIETPAGRFELTSQHYAPDVIGGDGAQRIEQFTAQPWPRWIFKFQDGTRIEQEILVARESQLTQVCWRLLGQRKSVRLFVRPFLSGRDYHGLHKENGAFRFDTAVDAERVTWNPYPGVPAVVALSNGHYQHEPHWYQNFRYAEEAARGLDDTEDLAAPGIFNFDLASGEAVLMFTTPDSPALSRKRDLSAVKFADAVLAILEGYSRGTRFGIRMDSDGLLAAGERGVQLTWMDAKVGEWVVTPRAGKPVEIQALWLNALGIASQFAPQWEETFNRGLKSFREKFWDEQRGCLYDVIDANHRVGEVDASIRPNQIFAVGGLSFQLLDGERAKKVVALVEEKLLTPLGLRSLAPGEPDYKPHYEGGVLQRDGSYHQGTVWPWLIGPFVEAWVRVRGNTTAAKQEARKKFLTPLLCHLEEAGLGHVSEIADAESPHTPRGCPFQAWSVGEALRLDQVVLAERAGARTSVRLIATKPATSRIPIAAQSKKNESVSRSRATRHRDVVPV